jgi:hypothetical protein
MTKPINIPTPSPRHISPIAPVLKRYVSVKIIGNVAMNKYRYPNRDPIYIERSITIGLVNSNYVG